MRPALPRCIVLRRHARVVCVVCVVCVGVLTFASGCTALPTPSTRAAPAAVSATPVAGRETLSAAPDQFLVGGDVTIRYREFGRKASGAEPVLLLHGYGRRLEDWAGIADSLARDYRVIAMDARGFGESSKSSDPSRYGPRPMTDDVVRLLDRLGVRRAHVVGHSLGAVLATNMAVLHPTRVSTATLVAGPFFADSAAAVQFFAPFIAALERGEGLRPFLAWNYPAFSDSVLDAVNAQRMTRNDLGSLTAVFQAFPMLTVPAAPTVPAATRTVPTLVIAGTADRLLGYSHALAARWPWTRLVDVNGADHGSVLTRPELLAELRTHLRLRTTSRAFP